VQELARAKATAAAGDTVEDLPYITAVVNESMRLYPPGTPSSAGRSTTLSFSAIRSTRDTSWR
jgi:cytochrome P450